jgi:hypothetical protein
VVRLREFDAFTRNAITPPFALVEDPHDVKFELSVFNTKFLLELSKIEGPSPDLLMEVKLEEEISTDGTVNEGREKRATEENISVHFTEVNCNVPPAERTTREEVKGKVEEGFASDSVTVERMTVPVEEREMNGDALFDAMDESC